MPPEDSAQSEWDVAVDAVVDDANPAVAETEYPYAARSFGPAPNAAKSPYYEPISLQPGWLPRFAFTSPAPAQYVVPLRFGMSAILGIMTALSLLFGIFRLMNAGPVMYLFFGVEALLICVVQMFHGKTPRMASAIAGAIILPAFLIVAAVYAPHRPRGRPGWDDALGFACVLLGSLPLGAFLGYITGTLAAGVFLVMDAIETALLSLRHANSFPSSSPPSTP